MLTAVLVTPPTLLPVTLDEAKQKLGYQDDDQDELIESLIRAATADIERYCGPLVTQTWKSYIDAWPDSQIEFPFGPVQSAPAPIVKYWSTTQQTWASSNYRLYANGLTPYLGFVSGASFPTYDERDDAIEVQFVAGYGGPDAVPDDIKLAIKLHVERHFGALSPEEASQYERTEAALISKYCAKVF